MKTNNEKALNKFIERLQGLIDETGVTITEVALATGLDRPALNLLMLGKRKGLPRDATIQRLANYFGCNPGWLKTGEGERQKPACSNSEPCSIKGFDESLSITFSQIRQWLIDEYGGTLSTAMDFSDEFQEAFQKFRDWKSAQRIIKNPERSGVEQVNV